MPKKGLLSIQPEWLSKEKMSDYEDVSKTTVIANAYDWNKEVHNAKYWAKNPWTSWFWSQKLVDSLEYIELDNIH